MKRIEVKGNIVGDGSSWLYDYLGIPYTSPKNITKVLDGANGEEIEIIINSPGGNVYAASEIYTALKSYKGKTSGKIVGIAASAASVVAMGIGSLEMSPTSQLMIHNSSMSSSGDHRNMNHAKEVLQTVDSTIANAYRLKTGLSNEELLELMNAETYMDANRAKELGFIDSIMFEESNSNEVIFYNNTGINLEAIDKLAEAGNLENLKKQLGNQRLKELESSIKIQEPANLKSVAITKETTEGGENNMDLEQLKNEHPDLFNEIFNSGKDEGIKIERERIKAIENLALPGSEELINKAKFEDGLSVEAVAIALIKNEKARGENFLANTEKDIQSSGMEEVEATSSEDTLKKANSDEVINMILSGTAGNTRK